MGVLKNIKHENFAQGIAKGMTADAAYQAAGYKPNDGNACRLKGNERVRARVRELADDAAERAAKTLDDIIAEYERIAFTGMSRFISIGDDGLPRINLSKCTPEDMDLLAEVQPTVRKVKGQMGVELHSVKIRPLDRLKALEKLGMHLGMGDKSANQSTDRLADALREISKRGSMAPMRKLKNRGK